MFNQLINNIKGKNKKIVFPEGNDVRILKACRKLVDNNILKPIILGDLKEIKKIAKKEDISLKGIKHLDQKKYKKFDEMFKLMYELRKNKMTKEEVKKHLNEPNYFGTMLVKMKEANGLVGGALYKTSDILRPALQLIKTKPGHTLVSSSFLMLKDSGKQTEEKYMFADCALNLFPSEDEIVDIAIQTAETAKLFGINPKVALLSYSTLCSGKGESVDKMRNAAHKLKYRNLDFECDGELQFDAALSSSVAKIKAPNSLVAGHANVFVFPDINAGNIGYKIAQRLGGYEALGPICQGINAPINDLSRGCSAEDVYKIAIITANQS